MPDHVLRPATRLAALMLAAMAAGSSAAEPSFVPVFRDNFPDPHIVEHQGEFIAYATNAGINLPMLIRLEGARKTMDVRAAVAAAREAGRKYISVASEILGEAAA